MKTPVGKRGQRSGEVNTFPVDGGSPAETTCTGRAPQVTWGVTPANLTLPWKAAEIDFSLSSVPCL